MNARNENFQEFRQKIDSEINTFLEQKRQEVAQTLTTFIEETKNNTEKLKETADALYRAHEKAAENTLKFLGQKKEEANKLLGIIGNIGFTGNYNRSLLRKQRRSTEQYHIMCHSPRIYAIYGMRSVVSCVFARGS